MQPIENSTRLDHAAIGVDVRLRWIGNHLQIALLRFEYRNVLEKGGADLLGDHVGCLAILDIEIVRLSPEIMARRFGLRRDGVEIPHADAADALPLRRAGSGRRRSDVETQEGRRGEIDDLPAV